MNLLEDKTGKEVTTCQLGAYVHSQYDAVTAGQIAKALNIDTMSENLIEIEDTLIKAFDSLPGSRFVWCLCDGTKMFYHQKSF